MRVPCAGASCVRLVPHPLPSRSGRLGAVLLVCLPLAALAEGRPPASPSDSPEAPQRLEVRLAELEARLDRLDEPPDAEPGEQPPLEARLADLEARLALLEALESEAPVPTPPPLPELPNALNPRITVFADATWRLDTAPVLGEAHEGEEAPRIDDAFLLRETEVDFRAAVDPFVDGVLIIALEQEAPGEFHVGVEEGYAVLKALPLPGLEVPPLGLVTKVGRFRPSLGRVNQLHTHDLPQTDRPLAAQAFLGAEGVLGDGLSARVFLPVAWLDPLSTLQLTLEAFGGAFPASEHDGPQLLANLGVSRPLGAHHSLEASVIGLLGDPGAEADRLLSAELLYQWRPTTYRGAVAGAQGFRGWPGAAGAEPAWGAYAFAQAQFSRALFVGARYDWTQDPEAPAEAIQGVFPYLSWYPTEFFRMRLGYEHQWRPAPEEDLGTAWLQVSFLFGAHPPHPYWVHR